MSSEVLSRSAPPPEFVIRYGPGPDQIADLRLRHGRIGVPLVMFLHGGFWRAEYDRTHTGPLATALAEAGFAVCVPEFRRIGQPGGGWPGTFDDVCAAVDRLPALVADAVGEGVVRADRVLLAGHSAGGHLALWVAARHRLSASSPWRAHTGPAEAGRAPAGRAPAGRVEAVGVEARGVEARGVEAWRALGVVALAPVSDLAACYRQGLGQDAAAALLDGGPDDQPERYGLADPSRLLPLGCPIRLVHGSLDDRVPCAMSREFAQRARAAGDDASLDELPDTGHFEVIDPLSDAWPNVLTAFSSLAGTGGSGGGRGGSDGA